MKTYHLWTVGCQVNVADSARLGAGLRRLGWQPTDRAPDADLIVVNTCAVRQHAEDRAAAKLANLRPLKRRNPDLKIAVMGCMVGPKHDALRARFPYVDAFAQPQHFDDVIGCSTCRRTSSRSPTSAASSGLRFCPAARRRSRPTCP